MSDGRDDDALEVLQCVAQTFDWLSPERPGRGINRWRPAGIWAEKKQHRSSGRVKALLSPSCDDARPHLDMAPSGSPQPPNLLGGLKDLPNPGLIGYFLQVLERIYNEALAGKTQKGPDTWSVSYS